MDEYDIGYEDGSTGESMDPEYATFIEYYIGYDIGLRDGKEAKA